MVENLCTIPDTMNQLVDKMLLIRVGELEYLVATKVNITTLKTINMTVT